MFFNHLVAKCSKSLHDCCWGSSNNASEDGDSMNIELLPAEAVSVRQIIVDNQLEKEPLKIFFKKEIMELDLSETYDDEKIKHYLLNIKDSLGNHYFSDTICPNGTNPYEAADLVNSGMKKVLVAVEKFKDQTKNLCRLGTNGSARSNLAIINKKIRSSTLENLSPAELNILEKLHNNVPPNGYVIKRLLELYLPGNQENLAVLIQLKKKHAQIWHDIISELGSLEESKRQALALNSLSSL